MLLDAYRSIVPPPLKSLGTRLIKAMQVAVTNSVNYAWVKMMEAGPDILCPTSINGPKNSY